MTTPAPSTDTGTPPAGDPPTETPPPAVPHLQNKPESTPEPPKPGSPPAKGDDEPLGPAGLKALQAEREARKADAKEREALKERLEKLAPLERIAAALGEGDPVKGKSEIEQITERLSQHEEELQKERMARWKVEAIAAHKLPAEWADRLRGASRDELLADAESLAKLLPSQPQSQFQGTADGGVREQGVQKSQLTRADIAGWSSKEIEAARKEGRLNQLMGIK